VRRGDAITEPPQGDPRDCPLVDRFADAVNRVEVLTGSVPPAGPNSAHRRRESVAARYSRSAKVCPRPSGRGREDRVRIRIVVRIRTLWIIVHALSGHVDCITDVVIDAASVQSREGKASTFPVPTWACPAVKSPGSLWRPTRPAGRGATSFQGVSRVRRVKCAQRRGNPGMRPL
jgi:hypothetical protein